MRRSSARERTLDWYVWDSDNDDGRTDNDDNGRAFDDIDNDDSGSNDDNDNGGAVWFL